MLVFIKIIEISLEDAQLEFPPLYYLTIFILYILDNPDVQNNYVWLLTYTYNYGYIINNLSSNTVSHFWSLCVEEEFYSFWPIIILLIRSKAKLLLFITICFIFIGYEQMLFNIFPDFAKYNFVGLPTRMSSLVIGGLGSVLIYFYGIPVKILNNKNIEFVMLTLLIGLLLTDFNIKYFLLGLCSLFLNLVIQNLNLLINF